MRTEERSAERLGLRAHRAPRPPPAALPTRQPCLLLPSCHQAATRRPPANPTLDLRPRGRPPENPPPRPARQSVRPPMRPPSRRTASTQGRLALFPINRPTKIGRPRPVAPTAHVALRHSESAARCPPLARDLTARGPPARPHTGPRARARARPQSPPAPLGRTPRKLSQCDPK